LLQGLKIIKPSESICDLLHVIEVHNKKSDPSVLFEITELGDPGAFMDLKSTIQNMRKKF